MNVYARNRGSYGERVDVWLWQEDHSVAKKNEDHAHSDTVKAKK